METEKLLYFAYGSNLCRVEREDGLGIKISPFKVVFMRDMELFFPRESARQGGGVASFRRVENKKLWGVLFEIAESDLEKLDRKEGVPARCYQRKPVTVYDEFGNKYYALTYEAVVEGEFLPSRKYMQKIISGAKECGLPPDCISHLETIKTKEEKIIARGAEAVISRVGDTIVKLRVRKGYRHPDIDTKIRKVRTRMEARLLSEARRAGVPVPMVLEVDENEGKLVIEFVEGERIKEFLKEKNMDGIGTTIGKEVGLLHKAGIAHGDLTTSNMIFMDGKIYIIDFGLAKKTRSVEDFAVDLHLLERALTSAHCGIAERCFGAVLEEYGKMMPHAIIERLREIEKRGRYKAR